MLKIERIEKKSDVYDIQVQNNNNFFANGVLVHNCNLNSINLANIHDEAELHSTCETAVRLLDNAIDFTDVPIKEGEIHNNVYRTIGVGCVAKESYVDIVKKVIIDGVDYSIEAMINIDGIDTDIKSLIKNL